VLDCNANLSRMLGASKEELMYRNLAALTLPTERERVVSAVRWLLRSGNHSICFDSSIVAPSTGALVPLKVILKPIVNEQGQVTALLWIGAPTESVTSSFVPMICN